MAGDFATRPHGRQQESQSEELLAALRADRQINANPRCIFSDMLGSYTRTGGDLPGLLVLPSHRGMHALIEVAIIGLGSWGLCTLERIIDAGRQGPSRAISVHVVEPARPGGGLYSHGGPDYLILNIPVASTRCTPTPRGLEGTGSARASTSAWLSAATAGTVTNAGSRPLARRSARTTSFPRRLMGEYLEWFYQALLMEAPPNVSVVHHKTRAVDIEATAYGRESVHMENGARTDVDHVILRSATRRKRPPGLRWRPRNQPLPGRTVPGHGLAARRSRSKGWGWWRWTPSRP